MTDLKELMALFEKGGVFQGRAVPVQISLLRAAPEL